jgi:hypothetical protein
MSPLRLKIRKLKVRGRELAILLIITCQRGLSSGAGGETVEEPRAVLHPLASGLRQRGQLSDGEPFALRWRRGKHAPNPRASEQGILFGQ